MCVCVCVCAVYVCVYVYLFIGRVVPSHYKTSNATTFKKPHPSPQIGTVQSKQTKSAKVRVKLSMTQQCIFTHTHTHTHTQLTHSTYTHSLTLTHRPTHLLIFLPNVSLFSILMNRLVLLYPLITDLPYTPLELRWLHTGRITTACE